jgi:hypothetical protein
MLIRRIAHRSTAGKSAIPVLQNRRRQDKEQ